MKGKVVIIGTGGIGQACSALCRERGIQSELYGLPAFDARNGADWEDLYKLKRTGPIGGLIYAAGVNALSWIGKTPSYQGLDMYETNVWAPYNAINIAVRMKVEPFRVVFLASDAAKVAMRASSMYCASKAALVQMTRCMARELAEKGWRINCVSPTQVERTQMLSGVYEWLDRERGWVHDYAEETMNKQIPMGRPAKPEEVAKVCLFLLSDDAEFINGANYEITGGK